MDVGNLKVSESSNCYCLCIGLLFRAPNTAFRELVLDALRLYYFNYIRYLISSNKLKFALPHFNLLSPLTIEAEPMRTLINTFHARLSTRLQRSCSTYLDNHLGQRRLHDVIHIGRISAGSKTYRERLAWYRAPVPIFTRSVTNQTNPDSGPGSSSSRNIKPNGSPVPDALHAPLRNRQPRIAAVKKEGTEDDPAYYDELTVPVSFPGAPGGGAGGPGGAGLFPITRSPLFDAALTTFIGLAMGSSCVLLPFTERLNLFLVFMGGVAYVAWYKKNVMWKVRDSRGQLKYQS